MGHALRAHRAWAHIPDCACTARRRTRLPKLVSVHAWPACRGTRSLTQHGGARRTTAPPPQHPPNTQHPTTPPPSCPRPSLAGARAATRPPDRLHPELAVVPIPDPVLRRGIHVLRVRLAGIPVAGRLGAGGGGARAAAARPPARAAQALGAALEGLPDQPCLLDAHGLPLDVRWGRGEGWAVVCGPPRPSLPPQHSLEPRPAPA